MSVAKAADQPREWGKSDHLVDVPDLMQHWVDAVGCGEVNGIVVCYNPGQAFLKGTNNSSLVGHKPAEDDPDGSSSTITGYFQGFVKGKCKPHVQILNCDMSRQDETETETETEYKGNYVFHWTDDDGVNRTQIANFTFVFNAKTDKISEHTSCEWPTQYETLAEIPADTLRSLADLN